MNEREESKVSADLKRSLGWRLSTIVIVLLSCTAFIIGWVVVTKTLASKDVRIEEIKSQTTIKTLEIQNSAK